MNRRPTRGAAFRSTLALLVALGAGSACASAGQSWRAGPAGIPAERSIRAQLSSAQAPLALDALKQKSIAPADALLRHLYRGLVALDAGDPETGAKAMDRAWEIADQRWTKRLSDAAAAMVTGDGAMPYSPAPAERMFIPYYGALARLARNEIDDTAVEVRRLASLLESQAGAQPPDQFRATMRYIAGVLFEITGERNDADVAYRNAAALLGGNLVLDTLPTDAAHGDVVVIIEDGFVQRPEPAATDFWLNDDEYKSLRGKDAEARLRVGDRLRQRRHDRRDWAAEKYRLVSLNWPTMDGGEHSDGAVGAVGARTFLAAPGPAAPAFMDAALVGSVEVNTTTTFDGTTLSMDVSSAVRADFERRQPARIARAVARAALRDAAFKGAEKAFERAGKDDEEDADEDEKESNKLKAIGNVILGIGLLFAGASSAVLDQPDLRAWQLLPDRVTVARLRLPVGEHPIEVTRSGEAVSLGTVTVRPGTVTLLRHRFWPTPQTR